MKDIAEALGVSVATVSRALKDSPRISGTQREKIKRYAREHNYYPNVLAESLRNSRTRPLKIIGVIVPQFAHFYFASVLSGIEQEAASRGYTIMVGQSAEQYNREVLLCERFYEHKVCGVIVSQAKDTQQYEHFQKLMDHGMPLVFYDRICTGIDCNRVVVDDYQGAFNAVTHLINTGCRRIAFYGSPMTLEISKNRYNGYRDALLRQGLQPEERFFRICDNRADAEAITPGLLSQGEIPDAFFAVNDDTASVFSIQPSVWATAYPKTSPSAASPTATAPWPATQCSPPWNSVVCAWARRPPTSLSPKWREKLL